MDTKELKMEKAKAIAEAVLKTAEAIAVHLARKPRPMKSMRICKAHRRRIAFWRARLGIIPYMGAVNPITIASQPVPKYAKGTFQPGQIDHVLPAPEYPAGCGLNMGNMKRAGFLPDGYKIINEGILKGKWTE